MIRFLTAWVSLLLMTTPAAAAAASAPPAENRETVVLLHGVALNRWFTARLAGHFEREGYAVVNVSYPSRSKTIAELGDTWLPELLRRRGVEAAPRVHFVVHSMGGLVVRRFLATHRPANLGRVVMIATPNHGSAIADRLARAAPFRWYFGCNLRGLGTGDDAAWRSLPTAQFELGVLAGNRALNPLGHFWLQGPHDGTVEVASTRLEGMADHRVIAANHTGILFRKETAELATVFLRTGRFSK